MSASRLRRALIGSQRERSPSLPLNRLAELDSVRGAAALSVVFHHFKLLWNPHELSRVARLVYIGPLRLVSAGHEAVILFFVLSGFVLSIPALRGKAQPYPEFLVRRIFRIYFPYLVALALSVWGAANLHGQVQGTDWYRDTWSNPVKWHLVLQHVLFVGEYDAAQFNTAFWSLVIEMRVSLIFPLLCAFALWLRPARLIALALVLFVFTFLIQAFGHQNGAILSTLHYSGAFVVGIFLARQQKQVSEAYARLSVGAKIALATLAGFLFVYAGVALSKVSPGAADWPTTLGAAGLIGFGLNSRLCRGVLLSPIVRFLGRVSYSIYLVHGTILLALIHLLFRRIPIFAIFILYVTSVICMSEIFYRIVEKPFMELGRRLSVHS